jgi:hypothetical protein
LVARTAPLGVAELQALLHRLLVVLAKHEAVRQRDVVVALWQAELEELERNMS